MFCFRLEAIVYNLLNFKILEFDEEQIYNLIVTHFFINDFLQSKLLEEYYRKQKKLLDFQVDGGPGETWHGLLAALHLQHIDAASMSQKLTM